MHRLLLLATQKSFLLLDLDKEGKKYRLYPLRSQEHKTSLKRTNNCIHLFFTRYSRSSQIVKRDENYRSLISKIVYILQILRLGFKNLKTFAATTYGFSCLFISEFSEAWFFTEEIFYQKLPSKWLL